MGRGEGLVFEPCVEVLWHQWSPKWSSVLLAKQAKGPTVAMVTGKIYFYVGATTAANHTCLLHLTLHCFVPCLPSPTPHLCPLHLLSSHPHPCPSISTSLLIFTPCPFSSSPLSLHLHLHLSSHPHPCPLHLHFSTHPLHFNLSIHPPIDTTVFLFLYYEMCFI